LQDRRERRPSLFLVLVRCDRTGRAIMPGWVLHGAALRLDNR